MLQNKSLAEAIYRNRIGATNVGPSVHIKPESDQEETPNESRSLRA
jgi:hypothetical protein